MIGTSRSGPLDHMRVLFGMDPSVMPDALQFPRVPPGFMHPRTSGFAIPENLDHRNPNHPYPKVRRDAQKLQPTVEDFAQMYSKYASSLIDSSNTSYQNQRIIPPGHPLYNKQISINVLKSENEKLLKENVELKKQLDAASDVSDTASTATTTI